MLDVNTHATSVSAGGGAANDESEAGREGIERGGRGAFRASVLHPCTVPCHAEPQSGVACCIARFQENNRPPRLRRVVSDRVRVNTHGHKRCLRLGCDRPTETKVKVVASARLHARSQQSNNNNLLPIVPTLKRARPPLAYYCVPTTHLWRTRTGSPRRTRGCRSPATTGRRCESCAAGRRRCSWSRRCPGHCSRGG